MNKSEFKSNPEINFPEKIYYIKSEQDETVLWGMNVSVNGDFIKWFDGTKERIMKIKNKIHNNDGSFSFERADGDVGAVYNLSKMTLSVYNEKVKKKLSVTEEFSNEEEMIKSFESTINSC